MTAIVVLIIAFSMLNTGIIIGLFIGQWLTNRRWNKWMEEDVEDSR